MSLQVLGSLLTSLRITEVGVIGVMLIMFGLMVVFSVVGASAPFRGPYNSLFRELKCGRSFWLCSLLVLCIWELTIWVWFGMLGSCLLDGHHGSAPFELVNDGDLLLLIERMLHLRGPDTVRVTKVKGHADEGMVLEGRVRELDRLGNDAADEAADFGRGRVGNSVIDARRNLSGVWHFLRGVAHMSFGLVTGCL